MSHWQWVLEVAVLRPDQQLDLLNGQFSPTMPQLLKFPSRLPLPHCFSNGLSFSLTYAFRNILQPFTIAMLLSRCFLSIILAPFIAAEEKPVSHIPSAEKAESMERLQVRLQDRFRLFRDVIGAKDESHLAQIRQSLYRALVLETPSTNSPNYQTVDQVFSILPIGTMPPAPTRTEPATVTITSVASAMPIESSVLEKMFQSLMEKHLESILEESRSRATQSPESASETGEEAVELDILEDYLTVDYPENLWTPEEVFDPVSEPSSVPPTTDLLIEEELSNTSAEPTTPPEQRKGGTKNKLFDVKHSNKIQVVPQFRHHDKEPVVIGRTYGKPKTAWYGEYARKSYSELTPTEDVCLYTEEAGTSLEEVPILSVIISTEEQWETGSDTESTMDAVYYPETVTTPTLLDAPWGEASKISFELTSSHPVISPIPMSKFLSVEPRPTPRRSKPSRSETTFNINEHPFYATVSPRTPEEIQSNRGGRRRSRPANLYGVFASNGVQHHTSSLTIGIIVFALVLVLL